MCSEENPNNTNHTYVCVFLKRFYLCFVSHLNKAVSVEFVLTCTSALSTGDPACLLVWHPAGTVPLTAHTSNVYRNRLCSPSGNPWMPLGESETAEEGTVYSNKCIVDTICSFPTTATLLH